MSGRRWLSVPEFCRMAGVKPDTARDRCVRGLYRCRKVGTRWRVSVGELAKQQCGEGR